MGNTARNYQNQIIEDAIENKKSLSFFLKNGLKISGPVLNHDVYTVLLQSNQEQTLVYKHSITSVFPATLNYIHNSNTNDNDKNKKDA